MYIEVLSYVRDVYTVVTFICNVINIDVLPYVRHVLPNDTGTAICKTHIAQ
jgi:hypothetical protein